jgi:aryl sulfotransferase
MGVRPALKEVRSWTTDSRRWAHYVPRNGDVVIATPPKCGTTWTQQIVNLLIFQNAEPRPIQIISPWIDFRPIPIDQIVELLGAQTHRRFLKSHSPATALPLYDETRYIHVARGGLDAFMSWHNHSSNYSAQVVEVQSAMGQGDETIRRPLPRPAADPHEYFQTWMTEDEGWRLADDFPAALYFDIERSYWAERKRENMLLVHYNDLKADLDGEMRRIAAFLSIDVPADVWPKLVEAASFGFMREHGAELLPRAAGSWDKGADRFFNLGTNARWRDVLTAEDIARYQNRQSREASPALAAWLDGGRLKTGDPKASGD